MATTSFSINLAGTIAEFGEQQVFTFEGGLGELLYFDSIDSDSPFEDIRYSLIAPSGSAVFSNNGHLTDRGPITLTQTGTYQIVISGGTSTSGDYSLNLLRLNQAPTLSLGTTITNTLTPGLESDVYRFTGTQGQRLQFDSLLAGTGATWRLYGPNNQAINSFTFIGTDFTVTLPAAGDYYLVLDGSSASSSVSYSFQVNDVSDPPPASPTTFPFTQSGSVVSGTPVDLTFTAAAGRHLFFDGLIAASGVSAQILDPTGTSIFSINTGSDSSRAIILPRSGTYTLRLSGNGSYDFRLLDLQANASALTLGTAVTETLSPSNGSRVFSFTGAVGQRLFYDSLDNDFDAVSAFLIGPSGDQIIAFGNSSNDSNVFTLDEAGTYQLIQSGFSASAVDFSFQLLQVPGSTLAFDSVTNATLAPFATQLYRFNGSEGQRLYFDSQSSSATGATWYLRGPNNETIGGASSNLSGDFLTTLPAAGSYVLVVDSNSASSIPYSFRVVTPTTTTSALTLSSPQAGTITELGEQDIYTFTGTAGQRLFYDALANNANNLLLSLISPSGASISINGDTDSDSSLITLIESGTYQLIIEGNSTVANNTGDYNFRLIDATAAATISLDTVVTGTLTPGARSEFYRFTASAGQRLVFDAITGSGSTFRIYDPGNTQIDAGGISSASADSTFTAPVAGTYLIEIEGNSATPVAYSFQLVTPTTTSTALTLGTPVSGTISELGEQDIYTFTGTAGQRLLYDALANNANNLLLSLLSPSGASISINGDTDTDSSLITLTESGTYQLIIEGFVGAASSTGDYNFRLIDATAGAIISLDTVVSGTLTPGARSEFYRFTASAGQRLVFDAITGSGSTFRIYDPGNTQIDAGGISSASADSTFTAPVAGTYLIEIEGNSATPVAYSFQLVTPTTTSTALTLGTPVSGTISELGEQDIYTFTGTAGQRLLYDALANNANNLLLSLLSPSGDSISINGDTDTDSSLITLTESGTYQLIIEGFVGAASSTGDYDFKLIDATASPVITLGTPISGTLSPGAESEFYRFTGAAGQRLTFDSLATATGASWRLYGPNSNGQIAGTSAGTDFSAFLESAGTYLLEIEGNSASPVNYNFNVSDSSDPPPASPTVFPFSQSGSVSGTSIDFTFIAAAGKLIHFDSLDPDFDAVKCSDSLAHWRKSVLRQCRQRLRRPRASCVRHLHGQDQRHRRLQLPSP